MSTQPPNVIGGARLNPRVIIADDHEWIRQILVNIVRQTLPQAEVVVTEDGMQALAAYREAGADFLVSNHSMPNMDGVGLIRRVREDRADLPILMVSVHPAAKAEAMEAGADWFLSKSQIMAEMPPLLRRHARPTSQLGDDVEVR